MVKGTKVTRALERAVLGEDSQSVKVIETLRQGRARIKKRWVQGDFAVDKDGGTVKPASEEAIGWCALGAVGVDRRMKVGEAGRALEVALDPEWEDVPGFNDDDNTQQQDVVRLYDKAIKYVKQHGVPTAQEVKKVRQQAT